MDIHGVYRGLTLRYTTVDVHCRDRTDECDRGISYSIVDSARDLDVVIDSRLTMSDQVAALCRAGYYQLRQLRPVARSLPEESAKTLVETFISSRLDYCNLLLFGISDNLFQRLQSIQNAAARLLTAAS